MNGTALRLLTTYPIGSFIWSQDADHIIDKATGLESPLITLSFLGGAVLWNVVKTSRKYDTGPDPSGSIMPTENMYCSQASKFDKTAVRFVVL